MKSLQGKLTPEQPSSKEFEFTGKVSILIEGGSGTVEIQRSILDSGFYALTDTSGNPACYSGSDSVLVNAEIESVSAQTKYRIVATSIDSPINYTICK